MMEKVWFEENNNNVRALLKMLGKLQEEKETASCDDHYDLYLDQIKTLEDRITELCEKPMELKQDIIANITEKIKQVYPNMNNEQAYGYIREALSSQNIIEQIVNIIH